MQATSRNRGHHGEEPWTLMTENRDKEQDDGIEAFVGDVDPLALLWLTPRAK